MTDRQSLVEKALCSALSRDGCEKDIPWVTGPIKEDLLATEKGVLPLEEEPRPQQSEADEQEWERYPSSQYVEVCTDSAAEKLYKLSPRVFYWMAAAGAPITELVRVGDCPKGSDSPEAVAAIEEVIAAGPGDTKPPKRPFVREIARELCKWADTKTFPKVFVPMRLLNETSRLDFTGVTPLVCEFVDCARSALAVKTLCALGVEGVRALLGLRTTAGSRTDVFPPGVGELIYAFRRRNDTRSGAALSVGGRALTKHCKRSKDGWWGNGLVGSDREKNDKAEAALKRILAGACWLNIHFLPHEIAVYEIRCKEGYGARWECRPPYNFRGFLEPQMENGHEQGWVH